MSQNEIASGVNHLPQVSIAFWSDVVCPWCYIGKQRLLAALAARPEIDAELHWRPFQLQPEMPGSGVPWRDFASAKFGGQAGADAAFAHVAQVGTGDGITFHFDRVVTAPNTLDAHRLMLLAETQGRVTEAAQSIFAGYFAEGANLNDLETLVRLAARAGMNETDVRAVLQSDRFRAEVVESQREADELGMQQVPFFTFRVADGHQWGIYGAAETAVFLQTLDTAVRHLRQHPSPPRSSRDTAA